MDLRRFTGAALYQTQSQMTRLRQQFAKVMDAASIFSRQDYPLTGIAMTAAADGESIRISCGAVAIDLLLTYSRTQSGDLVGRITAMLAKHPLEKDPVQLDWFSIDRQGQADFTVDGGQQQPFLDEYSSALVLTLIDRALTHLPT
jgi:hypothetical protein